MHRCGHITLSLTLCTATCQIQCTCQYNKKTKTKVNWDFRQHRRAGLFSPLYQPCLLTPPLPRGLASTTYCLLGQLIIIIEYLDVACSYLFCQHPPSHFTLLPQYLESLGVHLHVCREVWQLLRANNCTPLKKYQHIPLICIIAVYVCSLAEPTLYQKGKGSRASNWPIRLGW